MFDLEYSTEDKRNEEMTENPPKGSSSYQKDLPSPSDTRIGGIILWRSPLVTLAALMTLISVQLAFLWCSIIAVLAWTGIAIMFLSALYQAYGYVTHHKGKSRTEASERNGHATENPETFSGILMLVFNSIIPHQYYYLHACEEAHCPNESFCLEGMDEDETSEWISTELLQVVHRFLVATRELLLLKRPIQSVKLGIILYVLTRIGAVFNFSTLLLMATVGVFTVPKLYEIYKYRVCQELDNMVATLRQTKETVTSKMHSMPKFGEYFGTKHEENGYVEVLKTE
jgi:hypothetical protein